ncbi:MAG: hypothetical protein ACRDE5_09205 [Ginsengibacter sp.]
MRIHNSILFAGLLLVVSPLFSQQLFTTTEVSNAYLNGTRTTTGKPGKNYWQNRGDYTIKVSFDPSSNLLSGDEIITYYNNSPDTLKQLIIRLYPDLYKKGVARLTEIGEKDLNEGVTIDSLRLGNEIINNFNNPGKASHKNTNLIINPEELILPHSKIKIFVSWHYTVNIGSPQRTGMVDSGSYFIAYFFSKGCCV